MTNPITPQLGLAALHAQFKERSFLGPLKVVAAKVGRFFQIPIPGFRPFVVFGPEAARKVLVTDRNKLLWRTTDPATHLLGRGVLVVDGKEHDYYRALMEPALHPSQLSGYAQTILRQTDRVTSQWQDGNIVDMLVEGRKIALLIVMDALFGIDIWNDLPRIWTAILKAIEYISPGMWILWRNIPRPGYRRYFKTLDDYLYGIIAEKRRRSALEQSNLDHRFSAPNLFQHLIDAGLKDQTIRDQMLTMLIAGHDTSTALLAWTFVLLGQYPDVHARLVEEVDQLENKSTLLDQVIKESLRLYPPIHIGNRRVAEEIRFTEGNVPAGERMFYSIYLTHRDPAIWEQADCFQPERFARGRRTPPMSYIPFGGGPRACIGAAFGQMEAKLVIAQLLRTFAFKPVNTHKIYPHMGATLEPRPGVPMRITERSTIRHPL
jgi:cytochrome P450